MKLAFQFLSIVVCNRQIRHRTVEIAAGDGQRTRSAPSAVVLPSRTCQKIAILRP